MTLFDGCDVTTRFYIEDALFTGLMDLIGKSLPTSHRLQPISDRKELKSRRFQLEEAKKYNEQLINTLGYEMTCPGLNASDGCGTFSKCIRAAEKYINQVEDIANEGWFLSGNE